MAPIDQEDQLIGVQLRNFRFPVATKPGSVRTTEVLTKIPQVWTCIGAWHYLRSLYEKPGEYGGYLAPRDVIHWLIDTVSKNGTFILNVPGRPDGTVDSKEIAVLDGITAWMQTNGEAIYGTRSWKIYGEGPNSVKAGPFPGGER